MHYSTTHNINEARNDEVSARASSTSSKVSGSGNAIVLTYMLAVYTSGLKQSTSH